MTTLTDRYIWAVVRSLPETQRADIDRELRASIGDDVEARVEGGADQATAERDTILELGDPDKLAAGYADRPTFLIGPAYYFDYVRLLKVLYVIVLPIIAIAVFIAGFIAGDGIGEIIGRTVVVIIHAIVHLGFWPTLVFALLDRVTPDKRQGWQVWNLDALPQLPAKKQVSIVDLIATIVMLLFFAGAAVWQQGFSVVSDASGPIPFLNPDLWAFWLPYFFALAALEVLFYIVLYRIGHWTWAMAIINVPLGLAFAIPAVWLLANDLVLNHAFFEALDWAPPVDTIVTNVTIATVIVIALWDFADGFIKAYRARHSITA
jgi:hypothetical protein